MVVTVPMLPYQCLYGVKWSPEDQGTGMSEESVPMQPAALFRSREE